MPQPREDLSPKLSLCRSVVDGRGGVTVDRREDALATRPVRPPAGRVVAEAPCERDTPGLDQNRTPVGDPDRDVAEHRTSVAGAARPLERSASCRRPV